MALPKRYGGLTRLALLALFVIIATALLATPFASASPAKKAPKKPKNVIILISDGTGYNTWTAGDYWNKGAANKQP